MTAAVPTSLLSARVKETISAFCHELMHGKDSVRRQQVMDQLYTTPEGQALINIAEENNIPVRFGRSRKDRTFGSLTKRAEDATVSVEVTNTGNVPQMVMTLLHELRHLQQQKEMDSLRNGTFLSLKNTPRSHMLSLMYEADAFTSEAIFALEQKKQGDSQYIDSMSKRGHDIGKLVTKYIKSAPVSYDKDPQAFRRGLFTHIMLEGLESYSVRYFMAYGANFDRADTRKKMASLLTQVSDSLLLKNDAPLMDVYGSKYMSKTSVSVMTSVFFKAMPDAQQKTLKLVDKMIRNIDKMTEDEYQKGRLLIRDAVREIYATDPRDVYYSDESYAIRGALSRAATADLPALRKDFQLAAQSPQKPAVFAPRPAAPGFK